MSDPFRAIFAASPAPTAISRVSDGMVLLANPACLDLLGWQEDEFVGRTLDEMVGESTTVRTAVSFVEFEGERCRVSVFDDITEHERLRDSEETLRHGRVSRIAAVSEDITEEIGVRDALIASEQRFRLIVDSIADHAIVMLDPEGRVVAWNAGAERIKGYSAEEIIGRHFSVFYPSELVEAGHPQDELEAALSAGRYQEVGERLRKDGSRFWADVTLAPVRDDAGELRGFAKITRDIT
jgi:PAS domain S-box-containing protein